MNEFDAQITFCHTLDLAETARFYEELLGLELVIDQGECRVYAVCGDAYIGFCEREEAPRPEGIILTLVTDEVDEWYGRLEARGVSFDGPPRHNPKYDLYHCFLRDPNGYLVEIQRFDDPRWRDGPRA